MKNYAEYPYASVSMSTDEFFVNELQKLFKNNQISHIIESGTFIGLGSTTTLAKAIIASGRPKPKFYTLEVDYINYKAAKVNLAPYPFIEPVWAISVSHQEAVNFINQDEAILHHENYPDIFIDRLDNPQKFYLDEINGQLFKTKVNFGKWQTLKFMLGLEQKPVFQESFFEQHIPLINQTKPLFLLDSAGGLGWLEFNTMLKYMEGRDHFIILDDIHHLKHFRSYAFIQDNEHYTILAKNLENGWLIAEYKAK